MFTGGVSKSFSVFPLRVVYMPIQEQEASASILISVPKKRFKRAVKRNRVKRQIREAYRNHKHALLHTLDEQDQKMAIAFIYLSDELISSTVLEEKMKTLLARVIEKLSWNGYYPTYSYFPFTFIEPAYLPWLPRLVALLPPAHNMPSKQSRDTALYADSI